MRSSENRNIHQKSTSTPKELTKEQIQDLCKRNLKLVKQQKLAKQQKRGK